MLPATQRLRRSTDFAAATRRGDRAGTRHLVVHLARAQEAQPARGPQIGFIVSRVVGGAVLRNRTKRRLRALVRPLLPALPPGARVVVRANPAAATATTSTLERDLRSALARLGLHGGAAGARTTGAGR